MQSILIYQLITRLQMKKQQRMLPSIFRERYQL